MNLQAEKIQLAKMILDTEDKSLLEAIRSLFKDRAVEEAVDLTSQVAKSIEAGISEVKLHQEGKIKLGSAKDLLNEL